jgi:hypothetical protein
MKPTDLDPGVPFHSNSTPLIDLIVSNELPIGDMFFFNLMSDGPVGPTAPWKPVGPIAP